MNEIKIGDYIKQRRKEKKLTIVKLAELSGVSNPYISQVENNKFNPSPEILEKISKAMGISYLELMEVAGYWKKDDTEIYLEKLRDEVDYDNLLFSLAIKASEFVEIGENLKIEDNKISYTEEELAQFLASYVSIRSITQAWLVDLWKYNDEEFATFDRNDWNSINLSPKESKYVQLENVLDEEIKYKDVVLTDEMKEKLLKTLDIIL